MKQDLTYKVDVPDGIEVLIEPRKVTVKGKNGTVSRNLLHPNIRLKLEGNQLVINAKDTTKREKMHMGSLQAHLKNMVNGVQEPYLFQLKICASHFPMNVTITNNELVVKNFLGEKVPRTIKFGGDVKVKINGDIIEIISPDLELAGTTASKFEGLMFVSKRDRRVFQDGIYITHKPGVDA